METSVNVDELSKRGVRSFNEDGLAMLFSGFALTVYGVLGITLLTPDRGFWVFIALGWLAQQATIRLKERITIPRTGYVAPIRPNRRTTVLTAVVTMACTMGFGVALLLFHPRINMQWVDSVGRRFLMVAAGSGVVLSALGAFRLKNFLKNYPLSTEAEQ